MHLQLGAEGRVSASVEEAVSRWSARAALVSPK